MSLRNPLLFYLLVTTINLSLASPFGANSIRSPHPQGAGIRHCAQYGGVPIDDYCCPKASACADSTTCCASTQSCINNSCQNNPCTTFCGSTCCESPNYCSNNTCLNPCLAGTVHVGTSDLCCAPQMICGNACCETDPADFADVWCANEAASFCCPSGEVAVAVVGGVEGQLMCCPPGMFGTVGGACIPQVVFSVPPPSPSS